MQQVKSKSFNKGLREVKRGDYKSIKKELMEVFGISTRQTFANRRDGKQATLDVVTAAQVEVVFAKYGIKNPWGE